MIEKQRGQGIGSALVHAALDRAFGAAASRVLAATATADIDNLRFYQRLGFRMDRVERDAFGPDRGYPRLEVDGIPVRDRVWFSIDVAAAECNEAGSRSTIQRRPVCMAVYSIEIFRMSVTRR